MTGTERLVRPKRRYFIDAFILFPRFVLADATGRNLLLEFLAAVNGLEPSREIRAEEKHVIGVHGQQVQAAQHSTENQNKNDIRNRQPCQPFHLHRKHEPEKNLGFWCDRSCGEKKRRSKFGGTHDPLLEYEREGNRE